MNQENKMIIYADDQKQIEQIIASKDNLQIEVILGISELSRYSKNSLEQMLLSLNILKKNKIPAILLWDALYQEDRFLHALEVLGHIPLHDFSAVRVQDPGAVEYIKNNFPWLKIQLVLENGNHNLIGLKKWSEYLGEQCERLILSNELSKERLSVYSKELNIPIEVLVFGRILLFYSPRLLLSPLHTNQLLTHEQREAFGTSEESPHSGFPLIENSHGTFMFNVKDLYLLDHLEELRSIGIHYLRVDLRFDNTFDDYLKEIIKLFSAEIPESELTIRKKHLRPLIKGFYNINKTDVLFSKLKNNRTQRNDNDYIGEIVDVERDKQLTIMVKSKNPQIENMREVKMITPDGKEKIVEIAWAKNSSGENVQKFSQNDLILIPYVRGVSVKTQIYLNFKT